MTTASTYPLPTPYPGAAHSRATTPLGPDVHLWTARTQHTAPLPESGATLRAGCFTHGIQRATTPIPYPVLAVTDGPPVAVSVEHGADVTGHRAWIDATVFDAGAACWHGAIGSEVCGDDDGGQCRGCGLTYHPLPASSHEEAASELVSIQEGDMALHARLADVALESAEDAVAILRQTLGRARELRAAGAITLAQADVLLDEFARALAEAIAACEDIERASVGELIAASWLTGGPSPHLSRRALALGLNVGGLRLVVRNGEALDVA